MLYYIKALYYTCFLPPGIFIVALLVCAWRLPNNRRTVKWCVGLAGTLYICSTYWFASVLVQPLEKAYQPPSQLHGDVVLMLGGGAINWLLSRYARLTTLSTVPPARRAAAG